MGISSWALQADELARRYSYVCLIRGRLFGFKGKQEIISDGFVDLCLCSSI